MLPRSRRLPAVVVVLTLLIQATHASRLLAAAPTLDHVFPVAVQVGTTTAITAVGKFAPWPAKVWADAPGISFHAEKTAGKFNVEVGADVPAGPHLIRLFNESGASAPRFLIVTAEKEETETEPNDDYAKAATIERLPATINGRLNKSGDVDSYAFKLETDQTLIASLEAFVLASPVDAVLRLVDSRGLEVALNHDDGRTLDPFLTWTARAAGSYVLQVFGFAHPATADVKFTGSDACVYRLHLSRGPQVRYTLPLGIQRAKDAELRVFGWNLGALSGRNFEVNGSAFARDGSRAIWRRTEFETAFSLPLGEGPESIDQDLSARLNELPAVARVFRTDKQRVDPSFASGKAAPSGADGNAVGAPHPHELSALTPPYAITGCIGKIGEEDRFAFAAVKGETLLLEIQSASLGFPLDAWLAIQDGTGKELARNDDATSADPVLEWTAPETGTYVAVVGSVLHRGGVDHLYRLSIQPARPGFKAVIAESGFSIEPGKTTKIKVTARRVHGFKSKLAASATGLPEGLTIAVAELGETEKEITLELTATADAMSFSGPIGISFAEANSDTVHAAVYELTSTSLKNGVPQGFRDLVIKSTDKLWLTVLPAPQAKPAADEK